MPAPTQQIIQILPDCLLVEIEFLTPVAYIAQITTRNIYFAIQHTYYQRNLTYIELIGYSLTPPLVILQFFLFPFILGKIYTALGHNGYRLLLRLTDELLLQLVGENIGIETTLV